MKEHVCIVCGKKYYRDNYIIHTKFCSKGCNVEYQRKGAILAQLSRERLEKETVSKVCIVCNIEQPIDNFSKSERGKDWHAIRCKACCVIASNSKRKLTVNYLSKFKSCQRKNKMSPEMYYETVILKIHKRRGGLSESQETLTYEDWVGVVSNQNNKCAICGVEFGEATPPTIDHIISLKRGGVLSPKNVQALCISCNCKKADRCYSGIAHKVDRSKEVIGSA